MTPTLSGRWQTRLLLFATVGVLVSLPFAMGAIGPGASSSYFWVLGYLALFGLGWDILYSYLQRFRWDRDWSALLQLVAGVWEGLFFLSIVKAIGLANLPTDLPIEWFALHYGLVWLAVFITSQSLMRIIFPRWRFRGGQWL